MANSLLPSYLREITKYLEKDESELWNWFASAKVKSDHADDVRLNLLKSTYRLDEETEPELYAAASRITDVLKINTPVTLYQAQQTQDLNASLAYIPGEPHVIFYGPLLKTLQLKEIEAILGHELHHYILWETDQQRYFTANQILNALAEDRQADSSHYESARLFSLYCEVYCDRGAYIAAEDLNITISAMVKMTTGLENVNAQAYLKQANEILEKQNSGSENTTHPESFLRTKALQLWAEKEDENEIANLIRGPVTLNQLDLLEKNKILNLTRTLIQVLLQYPWIKSDAIIAHARQFFHDIDNLEQAKENTSNEQNQTLLEQTFRNMDKSIQDYFCYILLDFSVVDQSLEEASLTACIVLSDNLGIQTRFSELAKNELNLTKKKYDALRNDASNLLNKLNNAGLNDE